jgi:hypothetical protein
MANTGTILVAAAGDQLLGVFRGCRYTKWYCLIRRGGFRS